MKNIRTIICLIIYLIFLFNGLLIYAQDPDNYCDPPTYSSKATWYDFPAVVHCSYPKDTLPQYFAAINGSDYDIANGCGRCIEVSMPGSGKAPIVIQIVDECPYPENMQWCYPGSRHVDMGPAAFEYFADLAVGVIDIEWKYVECKVTGNMSYAFKDGSSIWWSGIMIRNFPTSLRKVEIKTPSTSYKSLIRADYNFWLDESGFGQGPYYLRLTDILGNTVEAHDIPSLSNDPVPAPIIEHPLDVQFPGCSDTPVTKLGDVNTDNVITIVDALLVAQYYVGLDPVSFAILNADVNCDKSVGIIDALLISQYYVGLINQFC